jgi:predicted glycogen debranching enzyme
VLWRREKVTRNEGDKAVVAGFDGIRFDRDQLQNLDSSLRREWLVANGSGGYASASIAGANTRHYHGLLVAALKPPLGRAVLLSKLDETLEIRDAQGGVSHYELGVNLYPGAVHPEGWKRLAAWQSAPAPTWVWEIDAATRLEKRVWMAVGANVTYIAYRLLAAPDDSKVRITLLPLVAWRDYHSEMAACIASPSVEWRRALAAEGHAAELRLTLPPILHVSEAPTLLRLALADEAGQALPDVDYVGRADWYYRFQHPREAERGLDSREDLFQPGTISLPLGVGQTVVCIAAVGDTPAPAPQAAWLHLTTEQTKLTDRYAAQGEFAQQLALAAEAFVVASPGTRTTIIAGYHWFSDWGRDTMIALPGLCLSTARTQEAREILRAFADYVDEGMLPNRFPDAGETPEYNTVDATLWYFVAIWRYIKTTGDLDLLRQTLWPILVEIVRRHREGTRYNIHVDPADDLLYAGQAGVQLTWMDAKVGDWVVTPRIGKPVEICALWYNVQRIMGEFAGHCGDAGAAGEYEAAAERTKAGFNARFVRPDGRGLYDVLDTPAGGADAAIRPNQIFALSLPFPPIDPASQAARGLLGVVREELLTPVGLRTLSPADPAYRPRYQGGPLERDGAYHQGTVWPWLLGAYAEAHARVTGDRAGARELLMPLQDQLAVYGVGSLAEIYDADEPRHPNGCIAQAWSVGETLRVLLSLGG